MEFVLGFGSISRRSLCVKIIKFILVQMLFTITFYHLHPLSFSTPCLPGKPATSAVSSNICFCFPRRAIELDQPQSSPSFSYNPSITKEGNRGIVCSLLTSLFFTTLFIHSFSNVNYESLIFYSIHQYFFCQNFYT